MTYGDLEGFKAYLRIPEDDDQDDTELTRALEAATGEIEHLTSRSFATPAMAPVARFFPAYWDGNFGAYIVPIDDLMDTDDLEVGLWNGTDYDTAVDPLTVVALPRSGGAGETPWNALLLPSGSSPDVDYPDAVMVVASFGWAATPERVVQATYIQAARIHTRRSAVFGVVGAPDGSDATRLLDRIDPDAVVLLRGLIKYWAAR